LLAGTWQAAFLGEIEPRAARPGTAPASDASRLSLSPGCQITPVGWLIIIGGFWPQGLALLGDYLSAERAAARAAEDAAFERLASQQIPGWERNHAEVRAQARQTLQNAGLSPDELHYLWNGDHSIDIHSSILQLILAKAAMWDSATAKAHQARQTPLPQVVRPGVARSRDDGAASVAELERRLNRASGRQALQIATQLQRAKRGG
jgi:hypothetical protein